jgi:hypothetical protein
MVRHQLTVTQQLKGVRAAIRSKKTPPQLKAGLRKRADQLLAVLASQAKPKGGLG